MNALVDGHGGANSTSDVPAASKDMLHFYIFGNNIAHSLSPAMHNAGFKKLGYPGYYTIHETVAVDDSIAALIRRPDFGGASVTFPHKLQIGRLVDNILPRARSVGAVNTITVRQNSTTPAAPRSLEGDNTDWTGIRACILKAGLTSLEESCAVVLGAGGAARAACYAFETLGLTDVVIVNRTPARAREMAAHFPKLRARVCTTLDEARAAAGPRTIRVIVGSIPADDLTADKIPSSLFEGVESGVLVEMAYRPLETGMMKVAARHTGWHIFKGMDVLREQAYAQFELWTGQPAPTAVMEQAMEEELKRRREGKSVL